MGAGPEEGVRSFPFEVQVSSPARHSPLLCLFAPKEMLPSEQEGRKVSEGFFGI